MRTIAIAVALALLAGPAVAQQQTFRNERGQITGTASTSGNVTTFRDRSGRITGTAERMRDGSVQYRDAMGSVPLVGEFRIRWGAQRSRNENESRWPVLAPRESGCMSQLLSRAFH